MTWFAQRTTFLQSPWGKWFAYMGNMEKNSLNNLFCPTPKSTKGGVRPITRGANSLAGAAWVTWKALRRIHSAHTPMRQPYTQPMDGGYEKEEHFQILLLYLNTLTERSPSASEATLLWNNCYKTKKSPNSRNYTTLYYYELCPFKAWHMGPNHLTPPHRIPSNSKETKQRESMASFPLSARFVEEQPMIRATNLNHELMSGKLTKNRTDFFAEGWVRDFGQPPTWKRTTSLLSGYETVTRMIRSTVTRRYQTQFGSTVNHG